MSDREPRFSLRDLRRRFTEAARASSEEDSPHSIAAAAPPPHSTTTTSAPSGPVAVEPTPHRPHPRTDTEAQPSPELPELRQAILDPSTLDQLFSDIACHTRLLQVIPKTTRHRFVEDASVSLERGRRMLDAGSIRALQLRYLHDGAEWWDTLVRSDEGIRIVRIRHDLPRERTR